MTGGMSEVRLVALSSVVAAVFLVVLKLVVGYLSGSLGVLSEAAHSGLDLLAAVVTFLAVRAASKPADVDHHFGHGKVENLAALAETLLLFIACGWIIWEALSRILFRIVDIEVSVWAFLVMVVSIVVDFSRARVLERTAKKYNSQALEADALHFRTDIWSSFVVITGLILVRISDSTGFGVLRQLRHFSLEAFVFSEFFAFDALRYADPVAALIVACFVVFVGCRLGKRAVDALLDRAPRGVAELVERAACEVEGVEKCLRVRVRSSGSRYFVDVSVSVDESYSLRKAHEVALNVERKVKEVLPSADVTVHTDPAETRRGGDAQRIRGIAVASGFTVHDVHVHELGERRYVDLHLEVPSSFSLSETHDLADRLEEKIKERVSGVEEINIHLEPAERQAISLREEDSGTMQEAIKKAVERIIGAGKCHEVRVRKARGKLYVYIHCTLDGATPIGEVHKLTSKIELEIMKKIPEVEEVNVHVEPS